VISRQTPKNCADSKDLSTQNCRGRRPVAARFAQKRIKALHLAHSKHFSFHPNSCSFYRCNTPLGAGFGTTFAPGTWLIVNTNPNQTITNSIGSFPAMCAGTGPNSGANTNGCVKITQPVKDSAIP
jgi:hypothetical protein